MQSDLVRGALSPPAEPRCGIAKLPVGPHSGPMPRPAPPRITHHEVRVEGLDPRHDGVRIAQLSDIHVGNLTPVAHIRAAIDAANATAPDLIVLTGDYVCWRRHEVALAAEQLGGLRAPRVLAVLGNHDYFVWGGGRDERARAQRLRGAAEPDHGGQRAGRAARDDRRRRSGHPPRRPRCRVRRGADAACRAIVLCHAPDRAPAIAARGAELVMSGHTHGGQIYVKGITDRLMKRVGLQFRRGMYEVGAGVARSQLYVTPGIGFSGITRRHGEGTHAEVAVLTLRVATGEHRLARAG